MSVIISHNQSAFIAGRLIFDNIMITHEMLHSLNKLRNDKNEKMIVKLDISKAYDQVEQSFIEVKMKSLCFGERWVQLVTSCISSVSYSIVINGQPGKIFVPSRGLRQGDPLSSYLFLMCAESFSSLINNVERRGEIQGLLVVRRGTSINYLLFAYDSILFFRAFKFEQCRIRSILDKYEKASSQTINNKQKSSIFSAQIPILVPDKR